MPSGKDLRMDTAAIHVLDIGDTGTGKTTFLSTWPKLWIADWDGGLLSIRGRDFTYDTFDDEEETTGVKRPSAWEQFVTAFRNKLVDDEVETIGIDSLTSMGHGLMSLILTINHRYGKKPEWDDYNIFADKIIALLHKIKHAKKNVVMTAHPNLVKNEATGTLFLGPDILGRKSLNPLKQLFDEIYISRVRKAKGQLVYSVQTVGDEYCCAKSRLASSFGILADEEPPDYNVLLTKLKAAEAGKE